MSLQCPFCDYSIPENTNELLLANIIAYHVEVHHPEDTSQESPFLLRSGHSSGETNDQTRNSPEVHGNQTRLGATTSEADRYRPSSQASRVECPEGCGETLSLAELDRHLDLHQAESMAIREMEAQNTSSQPVISSTRSSPLLEHAQDGHVSTHAQTKHLRNLVSRSKNRSQDDSDAVPSAAGQRLGKKELGPYAYEDRMPSWLFRQIERGPSVTWVNQIGPDGRVRRIEKVANETPDLTSHLAQLCDQDQQVSKAWLCSAGVKHIFKMHREGGFCGYRNIQMMVSWMQHNKYPGHELFPGSTPNIFRLQELIEEAWEKGFNPSGKIETGGILGTRKFIGTPEAQVLFQYLRIDCHTLAVTKNTLKDRDSPVFQTLLERILNYFSKDILDPSDKIYRTARPPLYFQHQGHSLTIIGLEVHKDGDVNLLVLDPNSATSSAMIKFMGSKPETSHPGRVLKSFRRGRKYLEKFRSFELLSLVPLN